MFVAFYAMAKQLAQPDFKRRKANETVVFCFCFCFFCLICFCFTFFLAWLRGKQEFFSTIRTLCEDRIGFEAGKAGILDSANSWIGQQNGHVTQTTNNKGPYHCPGHVVMLHWFGVHGDFSTMTTFNDILHILGPNFLPVNLLTFANLGMSHSHVYMQEPSQIHEQMQRKLATDRRERHFSLSAPLHNSHCISSRIFTDKHPYLQIFTNAKSVTKNKYQMISKMSR